ncbi:sodium/pantothenate symporter [Lachnospiraceae bacterium]|nr:sodium/pantothenate symporter [Lachnospiraceae bacterium]
MSTHIMISMIALTAYTALMFYVGIGKAYDKEVVSTNRGYFIGGGTGYFVLFFTTAATWFSTFIYMGAPGSFYTHGIGWIVIAAWNLTIMFLMGVFGTRLWRMSKTNGYVTPGDLLGDYYQSPGLQKTISAGQFIFCFPYMMAQIAGVGLAVSILTDGMIPSSVGCIYAAVVIGIYVYFGGFKSQAWVDTMQGIMFTVILVMTVGIMITVNGGGLAGLFAGLENAGKNFLLYVTGDEGLPRRKLITCDIVLYKILRLAEELHKFPCRVFIRAVFWNDDAPSGLGSKGHLIPVLRNRHILVILTVSQIIRAGTLADRPGADRRHIPLVLIYIIEAVFA